MDKAKDIMRGIKAAIFDLDGTLFDSVDMWHGIDEVFLGKRGEKPTDEYKHAISALGFTECAEFTVKYYGLSERPEQLADEWTEMVRDAYAQTVKVFDGAKQYLHKCKAAGLSLAVVTSLKREFAVSCMQNNGILDLFDGVFTADEVGMRKSSPRIFEFAANSLGVRPSDCVMFDDVAAALASAKQAGMRTVGVVGKMFDRTGACECCDFIMDGWINAPDPLPAE